METEALLGTLNRGDLIQGIGYKVLERLEMEKAISTVTQRLVTTWNHFHAEYRIKGQNTVTWSLHALQLGLPEHPPMLQDHWEHNTHYPAENQEPRRLQSAATPQFSVEPEQRLPEFTVLLPPLKPCSRASSLEPTCTYRCCHCPGNWQKQKRKSGLSFLGTLHLLPLPPIDRTNLRPPGKGVWEIEMSEFQPPVTQSRED